MQFILASDSERLVYLDLAGLDSGGGNNGYIFQVNQMDSSWWGECR